VLRGEQALSSSLAQKPRPPKDTPISLTDAEGRLVVEIPPVWLRRGHIRLLAFLSLIWNGCSFLVIWVIVQSRYPIFLNLSTTWYCFYFFGLIGLLILATFLYSAASRIHIEIDQHNFRLQRWLGSKHREDKGSTQDIVQVKLSSLSLPLNKQAITVCVLIERLRKHRFGLFLTQSENEWLVGEITTFLEKMH